MLNTEKFNHCGKYHENNVSLVVTPPFYQESGVYRGETQRTKTAVDQNTQLRRERNVLDSRHSR